MMNRHRVEELRLERIVSAAVTDVWAAWTTQAGLRRWWWSHWPDVEIDVDPAVGGRYRFAAPHVGIVVSGTYLAVIENERLSFTWRWEDSDGVQDGEVVDVDFSATAQGARVAVTHRGPWQDRSATESYQQGWTFVLDQLRNALEIEGPNPIMR